MAEALLAVLILFPVAVTFFLKSNAAVAFLALCGGFTAITLSGSDIEQLVGQTKITSLTSNNVDLALLIVPLLLTLIFTYKSASSKNVRWFSLIPAICAGGLLAIVAAPMASDVLNLNVTESELWKKLKDIQPYVVGIGLLASLLLVWTGGFGHGRHSKKHK
ncbi:hypothetical protein KW803_01115 [Candidatus Saccharibacteria bacterium]|nr:hypothetical protein [Candidatus Saccharibacteria bacterium]